MRKAILLCRARTRASKNLLLVQEGTLQQLAKENNFEIVDSIKFIGEKCEFNKELQNIVRRIMLGEANFIIVDTLQCISSDPEKIADFILSVYSSGGKTVFRKYSPIWQ